jgi:hypothetical protein
MRILLISYINDKKNYRLYQDIVEKKVLCKAIKNESGELVFKWNKILPNNVSLVKEAVRAWYLAQESFLFKNPELDHLDFILRNMKLYKQLQELYKIGSDGLLKLEFTPINNLLRSYPTKESRKDVSLYTKRSGKQYKYK